MTAHDTDVKHAKQIPLNRVSATPFTIFYTARRLLQFGPSALLVERQLLLANRIMEIMPSISFRTLSTSISSELVYVPKHTLRKRLCNNLTIIVDLNQVPPTSTENPSLAAAVNIIQSDNENTSSPKVVNIQVSNEWRSTINITDDYAAYCDDCIWMLETFKSMSEWILRSHVYRLQQSWIGFAGNKAITLRPIPSWTKSKR